MDLKTTGTAVAGVGGVAALVWWLSQQQRPGPPVAKNNRGSVLQSGSYLLPNQYLRSPNGAYTFVLQTDGNLVLYADASVSGTTWKGQVLASTGTNGKTVAVAVMQTDGNFVLYNSTLNVGGAWKGHPLWATGSNGHPGAILTLENNGDVVISVQGQAVWSSNTSQSSNAVANAINGAISAAQNAVSTAQNVASGAVSAASGAASAASGAASAASNALNNISNTGSNAGSSLNNLLPTGGSDDSGDSDDSSS
jgi:hypothetical protein